MLESLLKNMSKLTFKLAVHLNNLKRNQKRSLVTKLDLLQSIKFKQIQLLIHFNQLNSVELDHIIRKFNSIFQQEDRTKKRIISKILFLCVVNKKINQTNIKYSNKSKKN
jgi:hypothetical protein